MPGSVSESASGSVNAADIVVPDDNNYEKNDEAVASVSTMTMQAEADDVK